MLRDNKIWVANNDAGEGIFLLPRMANRHGLIAGATGTGKTVTARIMAESFSEMGVPVFMADVKGDLAGLMFPGQDNANMQERIARFGLAEHGFNYQGFPVALWDIYGKMGMPLRTTVSEMGPLLMARILQLNDLQSDILSIVYRIADDNDDGSDICYGIVIYAAAPSFKISGNGTLDIEMSSESPRIGIQARKTLRVERARVSVNVSGSENATAVDLVYSDSVLKLINICLGSSSISKDLII